MNKPEALDDRRKELRARLRDDPETPAQQKWTHEEMVDAAQRFVASVRKSGKLVS